MEASKETIVSRLEIINKKLMEGNFMKSQSWSRETLLDAFISFYEECNAEYLKTNPEVSNFVETYRFTISELKKLRINISDFEVLQLIGNGNFGTVHLVKERQTGNMFAMKTIRKAETVNNKQTCYAEERDIMATTTSSWHTLLQYAFQDSTKLYLVMDYHPGGDLRGLLERQGNVLDEDEAVFYLRELIIAISNLHDIGYVHRDIKPDNVLLDHEGHIKLADFGSAARIGSEGTVAHKDNIAAGTPDYIAPEVLLAYGKPNKAYGRSCDYWSLGIIAYEMIFGVTPFTGDTTPETYNNIIAFRDKLIFPEDVVIDKDYSAFVKQLLTDEIIRPDYEMIICTPLFRDTCWDSVRDFEPPFVPALNDPEDTSLFTGVQMQPQPPNIDNFMAKINFTGRNLPFIGYTFNATRRDEGSRPSTGAGCEGHNMLDRQQRKIESLRNRLVQFEMMKEDQVELEQKYEECKLLLNSSKAIRATVEKDLATAMTETSSLRKTLEAERNERKDLELRAIDLIRSAKERWKAEEDVRNAELLALCDAQTQQITDLTTSNNELIQKLHRVSETAASCAMELQRLRDVQEQYENKLKNSRDQSRKSFCGLQNQLKLVSDDAESRVESLKKELEDAWISNQKLKEHSEEIKNQNKLLEAKLKSNEEEFKTKLSERDQQIAELNQAREMILTELTASNERENDLQDKVTLLQEEKVKLTARCDKANGDKQIRERECEQLRTLYTTNSDKINGNLEDAVAQQKAKDELRVKNLQNTINELKNEVNVLRPQVEEYEAIKIKFAQLESLVARLEAGKHKDTAATAREELLKEQLEKSQNQVKELHEVAALSDRELSKMKSELWTKEKALKDSGIDARILSRELQDAQNEIKALKGQVKVCEERAKMAEDLVKIDHERARAAEDKHQALINENAGLKSRVARLETQVHKLETMETEAAALKALREELELKIDIQQQELSDYSKSAAIAKQLEISAKHEFNRLRADLDAQRTAYTALQESSTILEQQVDGYDRLVVTLKYKEAALETKISGLENDLAAVQEILRSTKETLKIARNDRIGLDTTIRVLEAQMAELDAENESLKEDLMRCERRYNELVDCNTDTENEKNKALLQIQSQENEIDTLNTEILQLKEETSERLTHLLQARENNAELQQELMKQRDEIERLLDVLNLTEYKRDESQQRAYEEICSLAVRLKQFEKVSDSLLDRLAIEERKKRSLAKFFMKKNPEPPRPSTYYDLSKKFTALQLEYDELKMKHLLLESTLDTPLSMRVQTAMANASLLDARDAQANAAARLAKAAVDAARALASADDQKAYEAAQKAKAFADARETKASHVADQAEALGEFEQAKTDAQIKDAKAVRDAAAASEWRAAWKADSEARNAQALAWRRATAASETQAVATSASSQSRDANVTRPRSRLPAPEPAPSPSFEYEQGTQDLVLPTSEVDHDTSQSESHCFEHYSCMAKRKCRWCWQPIRLLLGASKCQLCGIIVHKRCEGNIPHACGELIHLWDQYNYVTRDVSNNSATLSFDMQNIVSSVYLHSSGQRVLRFLRLHGKSFYLYTDCNIENIKPEQVYPFGLQEIRTHVATDVSDRIQDSTNLDKFISIQFDNNSASGAPRLSVLLEFLTDWDRETFIDAILSEINSDLLPTSDKFSYTLQTFTSVLELSTMLELNNMLLIGGAQGLHAVPFETEQILNFNFIKNVQQLSILSAINSILIIAGTEGELIRTDLTQFNNIPALISNPVLNTSPIKISNHSESVLSFQCSVVNNVAIVCAATAKQIVILRYNSDMNDFQSVRTLDSAEPCSTLYINENSLLICADKCFNLNLISFKVNEMVDVSDPRLAHVSTCQRAGTYPVSIICLSTSPPEYMLCYSEFAVFVDKNGRKSRHTQINWKHFPLQFAYCSPNLYVFQFSAIEVLRVCPEMDENNREHWTCPPSTRIELIRPKCLMSNANGVYFSCLKAQDGSSKHMHEEICLIPGTVSSKQLR